MPGSVRRGYYILTGPGGDGGVDGVESGQEVSVSRSPVWMLRSVVTRACQSSVSAARRALDLLAGTATTDPYAWRTIVDHPDTDVP
jgi:hypothetical protein